MVLIVLMTSIKRQLPKGRAAQAIIVFATRQSTPEWSSGFHSGKITRAASDDCRDEEVCRKYAPVLREGWMWEATDTSKPDEQGAMVWSGAHTKLCEGIQGELRWVEKWVKTEYKNRDFLTLMLLSC